MTAATGKALAKSGQGQGADAHHAVLTIDDLVLLRIAATTATRADLQRDLATLVAPAVSGTQFRRAAELAIGTLAGRHLISETRSRLTVTPAGCSAAAALTAPFKIADGGWDGLRLALAARALGLKALSPALEKALSRPEGIAALVVQRHFGLKTDKPLSAPSLRAELAVIALEKAFGNKIKTGLGKGSGLPSKAGRVLAGQLFKSPRECATDGKLMLALAAEILAAPDASLDGLRTAVLRRLTIVSKPTIETAPEPRGTLPGAPAADNDRGQADAGPMRLARAAVRPDMEEFSATVVSTARPVAEGWPGNRKAFISLVWKAIRDTRPEWELSETAFKGMLAEAHRSGHLVLAGADLKDKCDIKELEDSRILYKNTVWHFVRVEE